MKTTDKKMSKFAIGKLKKRALDLKITNQITSHMCHLVLYCNYDDEDYVKLLIELFEHYSRVRGYYKKHKEMVVPTDTAIDDAIREFNERRNV